MCDPSRQKQKFSRPLLLCNVLHDHHDDHLLLDVLHDHLVKHIIFDALHVHLVKYLFLPILDVFHEQSKKPIKVCQKKEQKWGGGSCPPGKCTVFGGGAANVSQSQRVQRVQ